MAEALSKSAKKRAAKQARDAAHEAAAAAAEPKKEEAKPKAAAAPKAVAAAPKAVAAAPKAVAAPPKAAEQPKAKAEGKKSAAKKKEVVAAAQPPVPKKQSDPNYAEQLDDGTGDAWETAAGVSKKHQKRKEKKDEEERKQKELEIEKAKAAKAAQKAGVAAPAPHTAVVDKSGMTATQAAIARARELANAPSSVPVVSAKDAGEKEEVKTTFITATVTVPEEKIGRVIGPGGKNLKCIQEKTGVHKIDTDSCVFTISGEDANGVAQAELAIKEMVDKGYMSLAYDNFQQIEVMANPSTFPDLIGKGGCVIMAMKKELEVEISIPAVPKNSPPSNKKYPISVAGSKENTDKAKDCIESIINYYHHEITHPGLDHVEMEVEQWAYSFIIGKAGSEMRHIQKNWDVKVYIPREHSANQSVVIVGQKKDCDAARKYMEKQISDAGEKKNTDKRQDKADDHWGKEEPEEPWMKQHMYVRK